MGPIWVSEQAGGSPYLCFRGKREEAPICAFGASAWEAASHLNRVGGRFRIMKNVAYGKLFRHNQIALC